MVTGIRHWSTPDYTRVAIDVDREVKYEAGRVANPDRIFFDLPDTKLASVLIGKSFDVQDGFLKKIRVAQYQPGYTRVVLEVADVSDYSAFLLPNPYRLIIDIHGRQPHSQTQVASAKAPAGLDEDETAPAAQRRVLLPRDTEPKAAPKSATSGSSRRNPLPPARLTTGRCRGDAATQPPSTAASRQSASKTSPRKVVVDENDDVATPDQPATTDHSERENRRFVRQSNRTASRASTTIARATSPDDSLLSPSDDTKGPELKATTQPTSAPTAVAVAPRSKGGKKAGKRRRRCACNP